jgi:LysM repeat protein
LVLIGILLVCCAASVLAATNSATTANSAPRHTTVSRGSVRTPATPHTHAGATTPAVPSSLAPTVPAPSISIHTGDTLWALARHYGTTVAALQQANHLGHSSLIQAGATLLLPAGATVTTSQPAPAATPPATVSISIHPGDTLWSLARDHGTTVAALQQANHLGHSSLIRAGATLLLTPAATLPAVPGRAVPSGVAHHASGTGQATLTATSWRASEVSSAAGTDAVRQAAAAVFGPQYACAANIITRESGWNVHATNPTSGAYGLGQALPAAKMATAGPAWRDDPGTQLAWMRSYVTARYGGACSAWAFWQTHYWY